MQCSKRIRSSASGLPSTGSSLQRLRVLERGPRADDLHLALAADLFQPAGQRGDDLFLLRAQGVEVDRRRGEGDAPAAELLRFAMTLATWSRAFEGMQPRSRQTPPSRGSRSTRATVHAEIGGQKRGCVSARPAANDYSCVFMEGNRDWGLDHWPSRLAQIVTDLRV